MGTIIGWLVGKTIFGKTIGEPLARFIAYAGVALLIAGTFTGLVLAYNHRVIRGYTAKVEQRAAPATNQAASERANDTFTNARNEQEMHNVIAAQPDQPIAPTSRAHGCEQLRRAGRHSAACSGPSSSH